MYILFLSKLIEVVYGVCMGFDALQTRYSLCFTVFVLELPVESSSPMLSHEELLCNYVGWALRTAACTRGVNIVYKCRLMKNIMKRDDNILITNMHV